MILQSKLQPRPTFRWEAVSCFHHASTAVSKTSEGMAGRIFHSLPSVKEFFQEPKVKNKPHVQELFEIYSENMDEHKYFRELDLTNQKKLPKLPLVTFEGLDGSGKSTQAAQLTKYLNATFYHTPPQYLTEIKAKFSKLNVMERTAFYTLANYMAALELLALCRRNVVVLDRFWHSTSAYAIAQEIKDNPHRFTMPDKDDPIFEWPKDLLKPDVVFLLTVSEEVRRFRQFNRRNITRQEHMLNTNKDYRRNAVEAFLRMKNPGVIPIDSNSNEKTVFENIKKELEAHGIPCDKVT